MALFPKKKPIYNKPTQNTNSDLRISAKYQYYRRFSKLFLISTASMFAGAQVVHWIMKPDLRLIPDTTLPPRQDRMIKN